MIKKRAYAAMMSYEVSDEERERAQKCLRWFDFCIDQLTQCQEHLNLIYDPFKKNSDVSADDIFKVRSSLRRYRDKVIDNFNYFKKIAFKCYAMMQMFTSDTQIDKLLKSFVDSIEDIETQVNRFVDLFNNLKNEDFAKGTVSAIENIKKEIGQLEEIVKDRIKAHLQNNILARNWVDHVSDELQEKVEKNAPLTMQLVEERDEMIQNE